MTTINIGDKVKVTDVGNLYTTYDTWAAANGLTRWVKSQYVSTGDEFTVISIAPHGTAQYDILYGLEDKDGKQVIMGQRGVAFVSKGGVRGTPGVFAMTDFQPGMRVVLRNGQHGVVSRSAQGELAITCMDGWTQLHLEGHDNWDVVEVFEAPHFWEVMDFDAKGKHIWKATDEVAVAKQAERARLNAELVAARAKVQAVLEAIAKV